MLTASRILGTEAGSTAPAFLAILAIHVLGGLTAVASGAIAAIACKGSPRHMPLWDHLPVLAFWLLPTAIGAPLTVCAILRARRTRIAQEHHSLLGTPAAPFADAVAPARPIISGQYRRRTHCGPMIHVANMRSN